MATVTSRQGLKDYALRNLGFPVVDINIDEDQIDDRVDDALQRFSYFHYDATHHEYLAIRMNAEMLANAQNTSGMLNANSQVENTFSNQYGWVPIPDSVIGVKRIFPIRSSQWNSSGGANFNMFDLQYQLRLNELYEFTSSSYQYYWIARTHIRMLEMILVGENPVRFNKHMNRLYIDMHWGSNEVSEGTFFIVECDKVLNPEEFTDVYNDMWLKEYTTQLIKRQWGENLKKYGNYTLPGGMIINGQTIWAEASEAITRLEIQLRNMWEEPSMFEVG